MHEQFEHLLYITKADIVLGTESWFNNNIKDHEVFPDGYCMLFTGKIGKLEGAAVYLWQ